MKLTEFVIDAHLAIVETQRMFYVVTCCKFSFYIKLFENGFTLKFE